MIQSWRLNEKNKDTTSSWRPFDPKTSRPVNQQACNRCRMRKVSPAIPGRVSAHENPKLPRLCCRAWDNLLQVACSGESKGCSRCIAIHKTCIYAEPGKRGGGRRKSANSRIPTPAEYKHDADTSQKTDSCETRRPPSCQPSTEMANNQPNEETALQQGGELESITEPTPLEVRDLTYGVALQMASATANDIVGRPAPGDRAEDNTSIFEVGAVSCSEEQRSYDERPEFAQWVPSSDEALFQDLGDYLLSSELAESSSSSLSLEGGIHLRHCSTNLMPQSIRPYHGILKNGLGGSASQTLASSHQLEQHASVQAAPSSDEAEYGRSRECLCVQPVVFLLDNLETGKDLRQDVDVGLAAVKEAIGCAQDFLSCSRCRVRPEYMTLLCFLIEKLNPLCESVAAEYWKCVKACAAAVREEGENLGHPTMLGHYEADSAWEWISVMEALMRLQFRNLYSLMDRMKGMSEALHLESVCEKVGIAQRRVAVLLNSSLCSI